MPAVPFDVGVEKHDGASVLRLAGDVDRGAEGPLTAAYLSLDDGSVILDFTEVGYINSTGIAVIVGLLARSRASGRPVRAYGLSDHYRRIFDVTRISDFMTIYDDEAAAAAAG